MISFHTTAPLAFQPPRLPLPTWSGALPYEKEEEDMKNNIDALLSKLKKVTQRGQGQWMACCPAHEDRSPSLAIKENHDGRVLLKCFAGCGAADVVHAVGLTLSDLFPEGGKDQLDPFAFARIERKKSHDLANEIQREKLILAIAQSDREKGKTISPKDRERELEAFKRVRAWEAQQ